MSDKEGGTGSGIGGILWGILCWTIFLPITIVWEIIKFIFNYM